MATAVKPIPELEVLKSRNVSVVDDDPDQWPEFKLNDVTVSLPVDHQSDPISLLQASEHHPLRVVGRLDPKGSDNAHCWQSNYAAGTSKKGVNIVVENVRMFAYGSYEDGGVEIWAAGLAGWYVIRPSRGYRDIFEDMREAVKLLYFIADAYRKTQPQGKGRQDSVDSEYTPGQIFKRYAGEFLGSADRALDARARVHKHADFLLCSMLAGKEGLTSKNPIFRDLAKEFPMAVTHIRRRLAGKEQMTGPTTVGCDGSVDSRSTSSSLKRKRVRPRRSLEEGDTISLALRSTGSSLGVDSPCSVASNSERRNQGRAKASINQGLARQAAPATTGEPPKPAVSEDGDSSSDRTPSRESGNPLSSLRLKPAKPTKGPQTAGKIPVGDPSDQDEPTMRMNPGASKRKHVSSATHARASGRRSRRILVDEGIDIPTSPDTSDEMASSDAEACAANPDEIALAFRAHKSHPIQEKSWVCALDGCTHTVYGAPCDRMTQRLIREHYALHAYDDDERVRLVKRLRAPSLPVDRLMEKVKTQAKLEGFPGSRFAGSRFPEHVKQRV